MMKTKPSPRLRTLLALLAALAFAACAEKPRPAVGDAVKGLRPIGPILVMRMTRITSVVVERDQPVLRVPDSHTHWRVESIFWDHLGPKARQLEVEVVDQRARIHGTIPTHWQAKDVRDELNELEVLRSADIRWHVARPNERRPLPEPPDQPSP